MPHPLVLWGYRVVAGPGDRTAELRYRLRLRCDAERRRLLRSGSGGAPESQSLMPVRTEIAMGTLVTVEVPASGREVDHAIERAFSWFREIESRCSRFDEESELRRVSAHTGVAIQVSPILYEVVQFARLVAETTNGAFDPTVGRRMEMRGFDRNYRTGEIAASGELIDGVTWRDVELDPGAHTIFLSRPLTLDLGGIAKEVAVDLAARERAPFRNFAIDPGGDWYLGGCTALGRPWRCGIPHPRLQRDLVP